MNGRNIVTRSSVEPNKIKWFDARLYRPSPRYFDKYLCIVDRGYGLVTTDYVGYSPKDNYTDGTWDSANGEVLYFTIGFKLPLAITQEEVDYECEQEVRKDVSKMKEEIRKYTGKETNE